MAKIKFESLTSSFLRSSFLFAEPLLLRMVFTKSILSAHRFEYAKKKIEKAFSKLENEIVINDHYCCYV